MTGILEPQPPFTASKAANAAALTGWHRDLIAVAEAELPTAFTIDVPWNDTTTAHPLTLTFAHMVTMSEYAPTYAVLDTLTVPHLDGPGETSLSFGALIYEGGTFCHRITSTPLADDDLTLDLAQRIHSAAIDTPAAARVLYLADLIRVVRTRQREALSTAVRIDGGHDRDIAHIQSELARLIP